MIKKQDLSEHRSGAAFLHHPPSCAMAGALKGVLVDPSVQAFKKERLSTLATQTA